MLFGIDDDRGERIEGWIMPDNPSHTPSVTVVVGDQVVATVKAGVLRPLLREQGLHDTGVCGFVINERVVPGLRGVDNLELYDDDTKVRIYRRRPATATIEQRLFRLELQLLNNSALNALVEPLFHLSFSKLERLPEETAKSVIGVPFSKSVHVTGRVYFRPFEPLLHFWNFKTCVCLRDPVQELAEQLLILNWAAGQPRQLARGVIARSLVDLVDLIDPGSLSTPDDFESWLNGLTKSSRDRLSDPATRLLTCLTSDEMLTPNGVPDALDVLGECDVVGFQDDLSAFKAMLGASLDIDLPPVSSPDVGKRVREVTEHLRGTAIARQMLAADLEMYSAARAAYDRAIASAA